MEFNAIATGETTAGAGIKIWNIVSGGVSNKDSNLNSQKITVYAKQVTELDKEREKAKIAMAKVEQERPMQLAYRRAEAGNKTPDI